MSKEDWSYFHSGRRTPARGVLLNLTQPVIVWLTVCTKDRVPWLTQRQVSESLRTIWSESATAWLMGDYLLMPDHLHGFCTPRDPQFAIEQWIAYWKSQLSRTTHRIHGRWQRGAFHHRLRSLDEYREKWIYMMENPVRRDLVERWQDWPWRGKIHDVTW